MILTYDLGQFVGEYADVPEHIRDGLIGYVEHHWRPGGFLTAVLSNDLKEAMGRADDLARDGLFAIVKWLYSCAPSSCWGSPERVNDWLREVPA